MTARSYYLTLLVAADRLALVIELLAGECDIVKTEPSNKPARRGKVSRQSHVEETRSGKLALDYIRNVVPEGSSISGLELGARLEANGFQSASASPLLSLLHARGFIERTGKGKYRLTEKGKQHG